MVGCTVFPPPKTVAHAGVIMTFAEYSFYALG
jgi:acyl-coenzyme A thioesterase PaaI-like protein